MFEYLFSSPSGPGLVSWPQYDKQKQEYMELGLTQTMKQKLKKDRVHFATVTLPQKLQRLAAAAAKAGNWSLQAVVLFVQFAAVRISLKYDDCWCLVLYDMVNYCQNPLISDLEWIYLASFNSM